MTTKTVPISKINKLRRKASEARRVPEDGPEGWSKSHINLADVVRVFANLRLKQGFALRGYQFRKGGNGNGIVWALPVDAEFPDPAQCQKIEDRFLQPPMPPLALENFMDAIDGDGTPMSYLSASVLMRELHEFGAMWHGCNWEDHHIIGSDPCVGEKPFVSGPPQWFWPEPKPAKWKPHVLFTDDLIAAVFYTYGMSGQEAITRHTDVFRPRSYSPMTQTTRLALGGAGIVY